MAAVKNSDITGTAKEVMADVQTRAKTAYAKTTVLAGDAGEVFKADVEAVVESGKIFFAKRSRRRRRAPSKPARPCSKTVTEASQEALAAGNSPSSLMQIQGEIAHRNVDALVSIKDRSVSGVLGEALQGRLHSRSQRRGQRSRPRRSRQGCVTSKHIRRVGPRSSLSRAGAGNARRTGAVAEQAPLARPFSFARPRAPTDVHRCQLTAVKSPTEFIPAP